MSLTIHEAAKRLDGSEYGREGSEELWAEMKAAGLVAVFGLSHDFMKFRGAVCGEVGRYDDHDECEELFTRAGLLRDEIAAPDCPHFARKFREAARVRAIWGKNGTSLASWRYETSIPHATFTVKDCGETYCVGIVFALADVPEVPQSVTAEDSAAP